MATSTLRLLLAAALGAVSLLLLSVVVIVGELRNSPVADVVALGAPFGTAVVSTFTFFLGHSNGAAAKNGA